MSPPHPLFGSLAPETLPVLAAACRSLIQWGIPLEHPWNRQALEDLAMLAGDVVPAPQVTQADLDRIFDQHLTGNLGVVPLAAMVARRVMDKAYAREGHALSTWVLAAAMRRQLISPTLAGIATGLEAMRKLKSKRAGELSRLVPFPWGNLEAILDRLEAISRSEGVSPVARRDFAQIAYLLRSARDEADAITRNRQPPLPIVSASASDGQEYLVGGIEPEDTAFAGPAALQDADDPVAERVALARDDPGNVAPRPVAARRLRQTARIAARRALALSAEHDSLSVHEVRTLVAASLANLDQPAFRALLARLLRAYSASRS